MKKIISLFALFFLLFPTIVMAAPDQAVTKQVQDKFREANYRLESGINYQDFSSLTSDLYVAARRFNDDYPDDQIGNGFFALAMMYRITKDIWGYGIQDQVKFFPGQNTKYKNPVATAYRKTIEAIYPDIASKISDNADLGWYRSDIVTAMFNGIGDSQKQLDQLIKNTYQQ